MFLSGLVYIFQAMLHLFKNTHTFHRYFVNCLNLSKLDCFEYRLPLFKIVSLYCVPTRQKQVTSVTIIELIGLRGGVNPPLLEEN